MREALAQIDAEDAARATRKPPAGQASPPGPPAGWYPHPSMAQTLRYWDGSEWTDHIAPDPPSMTVVHAASSTVPTMSDGVMVVGYITAVFIPIVGFIIGIVAMAKGRGGHGVIMLIISVVAFVMYFNALTPDQSPTPYYGY